MPVDSGMWTAIVAAGLLFGLGQLPGVMAAGVKITRLIVVAAVVLNRQGRQDRSPCGYRSRGTSIAPRQNCATVRAPQRGLTALSSGPPSWDHHA